MNSVALCDHSVTTSWVLRGDGTTKCFMSFAQELASAYPQLCGAMARKLPCEGEGAIP
jgi:hypothetical protein